MDGRGKGGVVSIIRYQTPCVYTNVSQIKLRSDRHKSGVIDKMDHIFFTPFQICLHSESFLLNWRLAFTFLKLGIKMGPARFQIDSFSINSFNILSLTLLTRPV